MSTVEADSGADRSHPSAEPRVSVVIPCLNEADNIQECVERTRAAMAGAAIEGEVVVCDQNSTDGSWALAEQAGARVVLETRPGCGSAYLAGFEAARGEASTSSWPTPT